MGLLVEHDDEMEACCHAEAIDSEGQRMEQQRPAEDDRKHAEVHGIARVLIEATHDQMFWWINGCRGSAPKTGKGPQAPEVDGAATEQKECTGNRTDRDLGPYVREDEDGNIDCDRARHDKCKNQILEEQHDKCLAAAERSSSPPGDGKRSNAIDAPVELAVGGHVRRHRASTVSIRLGVRSANARTNASARSPSVCSLQPSTPNPFASAG